MLLDALAAGMTAAHAAGDLDAARVAHEAIGKLLAAPAPLAERGALVSLEGERRKRGRS